MESHYSGTYVNGKRCGFGEYYERKINHKYNGKHLIYKGSWKDDKKNGHGTLYNLEGEIEYIGDFVDDVFDGNGINYLYGSSNKFYEKYEGQFKNGVRHGEGKYYFLNKSWYEGSFINGVKEGKGKEFYPDGKLMNIGNYSKCKRHGEAIHYYENGNIFYKGNYVYNLFDGFGELYNTNGKLEYKGEFKDDYKNGLGKLYDTNGVIRYKGDFKHSKFCGKGISYYENGNIEYEGEYLKDNRYGEGKYYFRNGNVFEGTFVNGKKNGKGKEFFPNGFIMNEGNYLNCMRHGYNETYYKNGKIYYDGYYHNNLSHGFGKLYNKNGKLEYEGNFENGDKNGLGKLYNENNELIYDGEFNHNQYDGNGETYETVKIYCNFLFNKGNIIDINKIIKIDSLNKNINDLINNNIKEFSKKLIKFNFQANQLEIVNKKLKDLQTKYDELIIINKTQYNNIINDKEKINCIPKLNSTIKKLSKEKEKYKNYPKKMKELKKKEKENKELIEELNLKNDIIKRNEQMIRDRDEWNEIKAKKITELTNFKKKYQNAEKENEELLNELMSKKDIIIDNEKHIKELELTLNKECIKEINLEKKSNKKENSYIKIEINGILYNEEHPKWRHEDKIILDGFTSCLHDERKITNLIKKSGWIEERHSKHKIYTRNLLNGEKQTLSCPTTPSEWQSVWVSLKRLEREKIERELYDY